MKWVKNKAGQLWVADCSEQARSEGWDLYANWHDGRFYRFEVTAFSDTSMKPGPFDNDNDAMEHVLNQATQGSKLHILALMLEQRNINDEIAVPVDIY